MQLAGTNIEYARMFNRRVVLETIRLHGPISRADIARRTSLMFQTVSTITAEYCEQGLVHMVGRRKVPRGQPATLLALNNDAAFTVGLHLDRNQLRGLLVDVAGNIRAKQVVDLGRPQPDAAFANFEQMFAALLSSAAVSDDRVIGLGLAAPGPIDHENCTTQAPNFPGWEGVNLKQRLERSLHHPIYLERDAMAGAMGERLHGEGVFTRNFAYIFFAGGLGAGLVINGQPYRSRAGNAGEIGHLLATPAGMPWDTTPHRYLEEFVSLSALFDHLGIDREADAALRQLDEFAKAGDRRIEQWLDDIAPHLVPALIALENILDVERILVGGLLPPRCVAALIDRVLPLTARARMRGKYPAAELAPASAGRDAAALGAAVVPVFEVFAPDPSHLMKRHAAAAEMSPPDAALWPQASRVGPVCMPDAARRHKQETNHGQRNQRRRKK